MGLRLSGFHQAPLPQVIVLALQLAFLGLACIGEQSYLQSCIISRWNFVWDED